MYRNAMLLVLAAIVGYSANRFDVLDNAVPTVKAVGESIVPAVKAVGIFALEGKPGVDSKNEPFLCGLGRTGIWVTVILTMFWSVVAVNMHTSNNDPFPGGFQMLSVAKCWKVWAVGLAILLLPLELVARLLYIAIRIVLDPCMFVHKYGVRAG